MRKIDQFTNRYSLSKTLQFKLIPVGKTAEHFDKSGILEQDEERAKLYQNVKKHIDEYHKHYIDKKLATIQTMDISAYAELYGKTGKTPEDKIALRECSKVLRKQIADALSKNPEGKTDPIFDKLFKKECITELVPEWLKDDDKIFEVEQFKKFTTYFIGFYDNRKNMYTAEEKATAIAFRCIHDNLPRFLDNIAAIKKIIAHLPEDTLEQIARDLGDKISHIPREQFELSFFVRTLTQGGIDRYNYVIGGYAPKEEQAIKGINQYVNEHNQAYKDNRLPMLKPLYKQILSDRGSISFRPEPFKKDEEVLADVLAYYGQLEEPMGKLEELFASLEQYDPNGIFVRNNAAVTELSKELLGFWGQLRENWNEAYDSTKSDRDRKKANYADDRDKAWKKQDSISVSELERYTEGKSVVTYYKELISGLICAVREKYLAAHELLSSVPYSKEKKLAKNDEDIALLKNLLDSIKNLENALYGLRGSGTEAERDSRFYGEFIIHMEVLEQIDRLYDKVRNYITKKPYSTDKIKLNFENPQLLAGWDKNKEKDYRTVLLRRDGFYYLAIMDKSYSKSFVNYPSGENSSWEKMEYKLLPGPNKMLPKVFFAKSNIEYYAPSKEIMRIYEKETFKKGKNFVVKDCHKLIEFYQNAIAKHPDWRGFGFSFRQPEQYADISEFYKDVADQGYRIDFRPISSEYIDSLVEEGKLYLFQIYSKDFSPHSKGTPNLHTLYFKMLFDERNLKDVVYQLNGGAELFYRHPSITEAERIVHPAGLPIENRHPTKDHTHRTLPYDVIKDKRFTQRQFSLHLPIKMNFKADGKGHINLPVREAVRECENNYVIGIDRGERNLIYITVIDETGKIIEQFSCNTVRNGEYSTDYHALLNAREEERLEARQSWKTIEGIKELKEGYVSQIIHKICGLVEKYDALIAMEDLNSGFKNSRVKVEKQVYQKFEKMLIDKLNYMVDKKKAPEEKGGLLQAYQLAEKFESFRQMNRQNGFILYIPAWLTSKIDPTTGFVDLLKPKYSNVEKSREMIRKFRSICFNAAEDFFEITLDYHDFIGGGIDSVGLWTLCTHGERIRSYRDRNGQYQTEKVNLPDLWKKLFDEFSVDYRSADFKEAILRQESREFFERFLYLLRLTLQMRNSNSEEDYLISPVRNSDGAFYDSRNYGTDGKLPADADANGAYHISLKALWAIRKIKEAEPDKVGSVKMSISNAEWISFAQGTAAQRLR